MAGVSEPRPQLLLTAAYTCCGPGSGENQGQALSAWLSLSAPGCPLQACESPKKSQQECEEPRAASTSSLEMPTKMLVPPQPHALANSCLAAE